MRLFQDLTAIGITKPAHRKRLKAEIARLHIHDGIPDFCPVGLHQETTALFNTCTHAHAHARTHTRARTRTHARTHAHTHTHTHTRARTEYTHIHVGFWVIVFLLAHTYSVVWLLHDCSHVELLSSLHILCTPYNHAPHHVTSCKATCVGCMHV